VGFVIKGREGVLPIDVKSGVNTGAKSLMNAAKKYDCPYAIIVSAKNFGFENGIFNIPLYAAGLLAYL